MVITPFPAAMSWFEQRQEALVLQAGPAIPDQGDGFIAAAAASARTFHEGQPDHEQEGQGRDRGQDGNEIAELTSPAGRGCGDRGDGHQRGGGFEEGREIGGAHGEAGGSEAVVGSASVSVVM